MPIGGLLALIETLDHDQREVDGKLVHSLGCRRCVIYRQVMQIQIDLRTTLKKMDESIGTSSKKP